MLWCSVSVAYLAWRICGISVGVSIGVSVGVSVLGLPTVSPQSRRVLPHVDQPRLMLYVRWLHHIFEDLGVVCVVG